MENSSPEVHGDIRKSPEVKLAAVYNVFDGVELLVGSMRSVKDSVDLFIIVYQDISNFGEQYNPLSHLPVEQMDEEFKIIWIKYEPAMMGMLDEKQKRNFGINAAREHGCTHFIAMDCDEYYLVGDFERGKKLFLESGCEGSVITLYSYFGEATLRQENRDSYYVPFIHKLDAHTVTGAPVYPYYVDPTRKINCASVKLLLIDMHHYTWVRKDIELKARNSSAKRNIERAGLLKDYYTAKEGAVVNGGNRLIKVPDYFGITEMIDSFELI